MENRYLLLTTKYNMTDVTVHPTLEGAQAAMLDAAKLEYEQSAAALYPEWHSPERYDAWDAVVEAAGTKGYSREHKDSREASPYRFGLRKTSGCIERPSRGEEFEKRVRINWKILEIGPDQTSGELKQPN